MANDQAVSEVSVSVNGEKFHKQPGQLYVDLNLPEIKPPPRPPEPKSLTSFSFPDSDSDSASASS